LTKKAAKHEPFRRICSGFIPSPTGSLEAFYCLFGQIWMNNDGSDRAGAVMSSILKALKKIEKEKGSPQSGTSPIARDILSDIAPPQRRAGSRIRLPLILLVLLAGGIVGGVLLMQDAETPPTVQHTFEIAPVAAPEVPAEPPVVAVEQVEPLLVEPPAVPGVDAVAEVSSQLVEAGPDQHEIAEEIVLTTREATEALKDTATSLRDTAAALKNKVIVSSKSGVNLSVVDETKSVSAAANQSPMTSVGLARPSPSGTARPVSGSISMPVSGASRTPGWYLSQAESLPMPALRVNEIYWRPVAKDRLAVVNDLPVLEGVDIEGARVDRIFKDRIRFVVNGRYLEVKVSSETTP
jgi:hypothetical protein